MSKKNQAAKCAKSLLYNIKWSHQLLLNQFLIRWQNVVNIFGRGRISLPWKKNSLMKDREERVRTQQDHHSHPASAKIIINFTPEPSRRNKLTIKEKFIKERSRGLLIFLTINILFTLETDLTWAWYNCLKWEFAANTGKQRWLLPFGGR